MTYIIQNSSCIVPAEQSDPIVLSMCKLKIRFGGSRITMKHQFLSFSRKPQQLDPKSHLTYPNSFYNVS